MSLADLLADVPELARILGDGDPLTLALSALVLALSLAVAIWGPGGPRDPRRPTPPGAPDDR